MHPSQHLCVSCSVLNVANRVRGISACRCLPNRLKRFKKKEKERGRRIWQPDHTCGSNHHQNLACSKYLDLGIKLCCVYSRRVEVCVCVLGGRVGGGLVYLIVFFVFNPRAVDSQTLLSLRLFLLNGGCAKKKPQQTHTTGRAPLYYPHTSLPYAWRVLQAHMCRSHDDGGGLTADGEERVGLLAGHRGHALQCVEAAAADVDPALHLRLAEERAEECDGDDVELLLSGVHLLRAPDGGEEICTVDKNKKKNTPGGDHRNAPELGLGGMPASSLCTCLCPGCDAKKAAG